MIYKKSPALLNTGLTDPNHHNNGSIITAIHHCGCKNNMILRLYVTDSHKQPYYKV